jgi:hypothetical protein
MLGTTVPQCHSNNNYHYYPNCCDVFKKYAFQYTTNTIKKSCFLGALLAASSTWLCPCATMHPQIPTQSMQENIGCCWLRTCSADKCAWSTRCLLPNMTQVPQHSSKDGSEYSLTLYSIFLLHCLVTIIHIKLCLTTIILMCNIFWEKGLFSS